MGLNADLSTLVPDAIMIIAALAIAVIATGVVNFKIVFGPDGVDIRNLPTQILLSFLIISLAILSL